MIGGIAATQVVVENGPEWVQYLIAFGTAGAAGFAGWAALSARNSTKQARDLIAVECERDARAAEEALWRQARGLSVELAVEKGSLRDGVRARHADARHERQPRSLFEVQAEARGW